MTDATPKSARAIVNVRRLLEEHLADRYSLEILNIAEHVALADRGPDHRARPRCCAWRRRRRAASSATCRTSVRVLKGLDVPTVARGRVEQSHGLDATPIATTRRRRTGAPAARQPRLESRLAEAEDTLAAIRNGDVDALIVGDDIYTLDSANAATNACARTCSRRCRTRCSRSTSTTT